jgi:hypothetical protein
MVAMRGEFKQLGAFDKGRPMLRQRFPKLLLGTWTGTAKENNLCIQGAKMQGVLKGIVTTAHDQDRFGATALQADKGKRPKSDPFLRKCQCACYSGQRFDAAVAKPSGNNNRPRGKRGMVTSKRETPPIRG